MDSGEPCSVMVQDEQIKNGNMSTPHELPEPNGENQIIQKLCTLDTLVRNGFGHVLDMMGVHSAPESPSCSLPMTGSDMQIPLSVEVAKNNINWEEVEVLRRQLQDAEKKIQCKNAKLDRMREQLNLARERIEALKAKELKLRNVILQNSEDEGKSDQEIIDMFCGIRQKLLTITHSHKINWHSGVSTCSPDVPVNLKSFYDGWNNTSLVDRRNVLRAKLYRYIHHQILTQNLFGFGQVKHPGNGGNTAWNNTLESNLQDAENILVKLQVPYEQLTDWRMSTMKCAQHAQCLSLDDFHVVNLIYNTIYYLLYSDCSTEHLNWLYDQITDLCQEAVRLRLVMRQSKDLYWCKLVACGQVVSTEIPAEIVEIQGGGGVSMVVINTLFGALIKQAKSRGEEEQVVLEKAHVLVRAAEAD